MPKLITIWFGLHLFEIKMINLVRANICPLPPCRNMNDYRIIHYSITCTSHIQKLYSCIRLYIWYRWRQVLYGQPYRIILLVLSYTFKEVENYTPYAWMLCRILQLLSGSYTFLDDLYAIFIRFLHLLYCSIYTALYSLFGFRVT